MGGGGVPPVQWRNITTICIVVQMYVAESLVTELGQLRSLDCV